MSKCIQLVPQLTINPFTFITLLPFHCMYLRVKHSTMFIYPSFNVYRFTCFAPHSQGVYLCPHIHHQVNIQVWFIPTPP